MKERSSSRAAVALGGTVRPPIGVDRTLTSQVKLNTDAAWWMARLGRRRRTRQAAICPGEAHAALDPGISEWR